MSACKVFSCDAVHPERTPPACRAFLAAPDRYPADDYAVRHGWVRASQGRWLCPSCAGAAARAIVNAVGWN